MVNLYAVENKMHAKAFYIIHSSQTESKKFVTSDPYVLPAASTRSLCSFIRRSTTLPAGLCPYVCLCAQVNFVIFPFLDKKLDIR